MSLCTLKPQALPTQPLLSPSAVHQDVVASLEAIASEFGATVKLCNVKYPDDHHRFWNDSVCVIAGESVFHQVRAQRSGNELLQRILTARTDFLLTSSPQQHLWLDTNARIYTKPYVCANQEAHSIRIQTFAPQLTATFSESLIPSSRRSRADIYPFDHLPAPVITTTKADTSVVSLQSDNDRCFELDELATSCLLVFDWVFNMSIKSCASFFTRLDMSTSGQAEETTPRELWGMWTVVQRGHNVSSFRDCIQEAWRLCELLPVWINSSSSSECDRMLPINPEDSHHLLLVSSAACIIAASLGVSVPPGKTTNIHSIVNTTDSCL
jgi:hypothetical protein